MIDIDEIQQALNLAKSGNVQEAEELYNKLLDRNPNEPILLSAAGLFYVSVKNYEKAIELLEKAYNNKKTAGTVSALGFAEYERQNYEKSAQYLKEALKYGESPDIYNKLILSLLEIKNSSEAIEFSNKMFEKYPNDETAAANQVKALTQSGKFLDAEKLCVSYLKENSQKPLLWIHLGYLKELIYCDDKQAKECYKMAESLGFVEANYNIAVSAQKLGQKEEAEKYYKKMLEKFPNSEETITSLGMCYLSQKKFKEGYELFVKREKGKVARFTKNLWKQGDKLEDDVVVICEQGFGDHIQFMRYLPLIPAKKVKIAAMKQLKNLFQKNYPNFEFIDYTEINPNTQALRITDLAYILGMDFEHIPFSEGYLNVESANIHSDKLKVGLCWEAGAAGIRTTINRTIHVKCFEPFFDLSNIQIYSLQYDDTFRGNEKYADKMINLAKDFRDFEDTARALKSMDVVVTVDTSVAHLSGALGVKTFLLLPYYADWRWFDDKKTTPWYKSVEIFKQEDPISWEKSLKDIIEKLNNLQELRSRT